MSFSSLKVDELKRVVGFFVKDVEAADPEKPTKKELIAALASDSGQGPVTWEEYETSYLPNSGTAVKEEKPAKKIPSPDDETEDVEHVLVKYTGKNPRWDVIGFTFIKKHPYHSVPVEKAEWLIKNQQEKFTLALPSEVKDYYN